MGVGVGGEPALCMGLGARNGREGSSAGEKRRGRGSGGGGGGGGWGAGASFYAPLGVLNGQEGSNSDVGRQRGKAGDTGWEARAQVEGRGRAVV